MYPLLVLFLWMSPGFREWLAHAQEERILAQQAQT